MTSIFEGQPPKTRPFPIKTRVIWVPGIYTKYHVFPEKPYDRHPGEGASHSSHPYCCSGIFVEFIKFNQKVRQQQLRMVETCPSLSKHHPALGYPATNDRAKKRSGLASCKHVCASQIALTCIYPAILRILVFFSSSFSRKIHHPWRPSIAHPIS